MSLSSAPPSSPRLPSGTAAELHRSSSAYWATELPLPRPGMLWHGTRVSADVFPFNAPNVQYVHFARNAIFHLAQQHGLAGREVLVPAYFHGVEIEALIAAGVRPRFYAVRAGMRVEPDDIVRALTPQTRAIYLIHYAGFPGPVEAVQEICRSRGLFFIEDCALALLSKVGTRPLGSFGDASVFCLYKTLPTPDGGAVVLKDGRLAIAGRRPSALGSARQAAAAALTHLERSGSASLRAFARGAKAVGKAATRRRDDGWVDVGTQNFDRNDVDLLMSDVSQRIVAAQDFDSIVRTRRRNYRLLADLLGEGSPAWTANLPEGACPLFYPFVTRRKLDLWRRLREEGIQAVLFWLGGELGPAPGEFPEVDELRHTVLELPCHQDMTPEKLERVAAAVRRSERELGA